MKPESQREAVINRRLRSVERYTDALDLQFGDLIERIRLLENRVYELESGADDEPRPRKRMKR
jgi:hypothetical protein